MDILAFTSLPALIAANKKVPWRDVKESKCLLVLFLCQHFFHHFVRNHFFFENVRAGFFRFDCTDDPGKMFGLLFFQGCYYFLRHRYLISLWTVYFFKIGLNFLSSSLSGVFFLFLVVMYLDVPGCPLFLCSVHSSITCILLPFFAIVLFLLLKWFAPKFRIAKVEL